MWGARDARMGGEAGALAGAVVVSGDWHRSLRSAGVRHHQPRWSVMPRRWCRENGSPPRGIGEGPCLRPAVPGALHPRRRALLGRGSREISRLGRDPRCRPRLPPESGSARSAKRCSTSSRPSRSGFANLCSTGPCRTTVKWPVRRIDAKHALSRQTEPMRLVSLLAYDPGTRR